MLKSNEEHSPNPYSTHLEHDFTFWISQHHFVLASLVRRLILSHTSILFFKEYSPSTSKSISPPSAGEKSNCRFQLLLESLYQCGQLTSPGPIARAGSYMAQHIGAVSFKTFCSIKSSCLLSYSAPSSLLYCHRQLIMSFLPILLMVFLFLLPVLITLSLYLFSISLLEFLFIPITWSRHSIFSVPLISIWLSSTIHNLQFSDLEHFNLDVSETHPC